jgi:2-C-methyl-D-erythritol 2,4-cyclodiphosphate synthase
VSRTGIGYDSHRLAEGETLIVGGVRIDHERGTVAHSDGDVLVHALIDALLGAAGLGDIGQHFPDTDAKFAGADSLAILGEAVAMARDAGWAPDYADTTVVCQRPKLGPHREAMRAAISGALGCDVNVKFTTGEEIGFVGREEGIAALAVVTVEGGGGFSAKRGPNHNTLFFKWGRRGWATSASTSPTPTSGGGARTASSCWPRWPGWWVRPATSSATWIAPWCASGPSWLPCETRCSVDSPTPSARP